MKPFERLVRLNTNECLWIYILSILKKKPTHAYTLRKKVEERFGFLPGMVTAYRVLYALESQGFVSSADQDRKKIYTITAKGKAELKKAIDFYKDQAGKL
jgi:DNA-binding PadR family transcriptional regulator